MDSNHDYGRQRPVCCHYTIGQRLYTRPPTSGQSRVREHAFPFLARSDQPEYRRTAAAEGYTPAARRPKRISGLGDRAEQPKTGGPQVIN